MANSSNPPSHPLRSEPTSKPAGLHLNNWLRLSHDRGPPKSDRKTFEHFISDKALIDAAQSIGKSLEYGFQSGDHLRKLVQRATTVEFCRVMGNRFDAKDAFAFGIDLEGQLATVQLEDRQIIHRSLDRDFPFGRAFGSPAINRAMPVSEDRFDGLQVQWGAAAVNEGLKHLVHMPAHLEDQVSTVFDLIVGILITEPAALLLVEVEGEARTRVNPTLADLAQSPYSPWFGQGLCDLRQACGVRDSSKAVSFLGEGNARFARLAGNIFMAIQDDLSGERRMAADLDGQMAPVRIEDMKRVVVDVGHRLFSLDVVFRADIPHRRLRPTDQDQKQTLDGCRLGEIFLRKVMLALPCRTVDHGNAVRLGVTANTTAEPAGQPHQIGVFQRVVRSGQRPPPDPEPTGIMPHAEVRVQNDAIHAIVAAAQQILIESTQPIRHAGRIQLPRRPPQTAPQGPLFRSRVCEKA